MWIESPREPPASFLQASGMVRPERSSWLQNGLRGEEFEEGRAEKHQGGLGPRCTGAGLYHLAKANAVSRNLGETLLNLGWLEISHGSHGGSIYATDIRQML